MLGKSKILKIAGIKIYKFEIASKIKLRRNFFSVTRFRRTSQADKTIALGVIKRTKSCFSHNVIKQKNGR